ncbi:hypothetical protein J560_4113 [Acinetobacter baumannii 855125]|nr:hypothetical protein J560_4113 [Acinetobacter baumannii 855125]
MDKCREEFEQSPKTKELLSDSIYFDEKENRYKVNADGCLISVVFLNGRWEVWQEQQAKVEELQKRLDGALKETQYALQYVEEDMRGNHEFLQMAMIRTLKAIEQVLKGGA